VTSSEVWMRRGALLVIIREEKRAEIEEIARGMQAVSSRRRSNRKRSRRVSIKELD